MVERRAGGGARGREPDDAFTLTQEIEGSAVHKRLRPDAAALKVFCAWQADTPLKVGRQFIRDALRRAIEELDHRPEIAEPDRHALQLDDNGEYIAGSPALLREIWRAIESAALVVADVTPVGRVHGGGEAPEHEGGGRRLIHSDVAIELGYALHALGEGKLLPIYNAHYGKIGELPFEIRNRGEPLSYTLAPSAGREEVEVQKSRLIAQLAAALRACLHSTGSAAVHMTPWTFNKAAYFRSGEALVRVAQADSSAPEIQYAYDTDALCYLRLAPTPKLETALPLEKLERVAARAPLLSRRRAKALSATNVYGAIRFEPEVHPDVAPGRLTASTQLFSSGELWAIGAGLIVHQRGEHPAWIKLPYVSASVLERVYYDGLRALMGFAWECLSLGPPWQVECGVCAIQGVHLGASAEEILGPIERHEVSLQRSLKSDDPAALNQLLLEFFQMLHDAAGRSRPPNLFGFPPNRPR